MRLLIVEDEESLCAMIAKGLRKLGYAVDTAYDGEEALYEYGINEYDLIILDLNLPKVDGMEVLQHIRKKDNATKILILSARSQVSDRVTGLDEGANDYLIKPFDFSELEARVRNLLRRSFIQRPTLLQTGSLSVDTAAKCAKADGVDLNLTKKEYGILEYLMMHMDETVSAEQLIEHVWDSTADPFSNVLQYHIHMLKKKLAMSDLGDTIETIRGHGYLIVQK